LSFKRIRVAAALLALLTGAACGFQPLYGDRQQVPAEENLAQVFVDVIADRSGQMLRNELDQRLDPNNLGLPARYDLKVVLKESIAYLAQRKDASATRANLTTSATYQLVARVNRSTIYSGIVRSVNSYDILSTENEFGALTARDDARRRGARPQAAHNAVRLALALGQADPSVR
jgi:LPS-assembly lipoprotein